MLQTGEPRRCNPAQTTAEIPVEVSVAPVIPFVTEPDLERVLEAACEADASTRTTSSCDCPGKCAPLFEEWLQAHLPGRVHASRPSALRAARRHDGTDFSVFLAQPSNRPGDEQRSVVPKSTGPVL